MTIADVDLFPDERLLWQGRPVRHRPFRPTDALLVPVVLMFVLIMLVMHSMVTRTELSSLESRLYTPLPLVMILGALLQVVGVMVVRAVASRRTRYLVTDRRILVLGGVSGKRVNAAYLTHLLPPVITEKPDGSGHLAFGMFPRIRDLFDSDSSVGMWNPAATGTPVLWDVSDVKGVRDLIATAQSAL